MITRNHTLPNNDEDHDFWCFTQITCFFEFVYHIILELESYIIAE